MIDKLHIIRYDIHDMIKYTLLIRITRLCLEIYVIYIKIKRIIWSNKAVDIDVLLHIIYIVIRLSNSRAEILNMMEKYISCQGLLIQGVYLLLLIRLQSKKPFLEILLMRTIIQITSIANKYLQLLWEGYRFMTCFQAVVSAMNYHKQKSISYMPRNFISFKNE